MLAAGILVIGLMLVATAFPVAIKLTAVATERTIGTIVSTEASAKIKLFGDPNDIYQPPFGINFPYLSTLPSNQLIDFNITLKLLLDQNEYAYPSANTGEDKYYRWSALINRDDSVGLTINAAVFITRTTGSAAKYPKAVPYYQMAPTFDPLDPLNRIGIPKPICVPIDISNPPSPATDIYTITIADYSTTTTFNETEFIDHIPERATIVMVDFETEDVMLLNILEINRDLEDTDYTDGSGYGTITLAEPIYSAKVNDHFWVLPTAVNSSRNPCIGVYPETITF
jgi:hypothetical protein